MHVGYAPVQPGDEWAYAVQQFPIARMSDMETSDVVDRLNLRGIKGWELVGFSATPRDGSAQTAYLITCVWKRRQAGS